MKTRISLRYISSWIILNSIVLVSSTYRVNLTDNGPVIRGANITFTATVYNGDKLAYNDDFIYRWKDTAIPIHTKESSSGKPVDTWIVFFNSTYPQGQYIAQVEICKYYFSLYCYTVASSRIEFILTDTLNGDLELIQKNKTRTLFVSNAAPVFHNISIKEPDAEILKQAPTILSYWFIDCIYYGFRPDLQFPFNYTQPDKEHFVETLVVADFTPLPPPTTTPPSTTTSTTTTTKPTSTTTATTTKPTTTTTATTTKQPNNVTTTAKIRSKREIASAENVTQTIMVYVNGTLQVYNGTFPYVCNGIQVATDPEKTYGYFSKKVKVRTPVTKVNVTGNNWLQHGEVLKLTVKCYASKNVKFCVNYVDGVYNVTGNETCSEYHELETCDFPIYRYFVKAKEYTIVIIIENEVSKVVTPVGVTVYKVKKQAQLSVIVVPVAFSLVAVVLVVFGVAYYLQNRSRFIVEVADFNFGQNYSDMEYKTFKERLRDSIANAFFTRAPTPGSSEVPVWPPGRKYGSMTS